MLIGNQMISLKMKSAICIRKEWISQGMDMDGLLVFVDSSVSGLICITQKSRSWKLEVDSRMLDVGWKCVECGVKGEKRKKEGGCYQRRTSEEIKVDGVKTRDILEKKSRCGVGDYMGELIETMFKTSKTKGID